MKQRTAPQVEFASRWIQGIVLTFIVGFAILGYLAIRIYRESPPVPARVVSESGQAVFTGEDIRAGQEAFLTYGLMQYGSVYGHGAYLGPDFTADYLHRLAQEMNRSYGGGAAAEERTRRELRENRYDPATDVLTWTEAQAKAFDVLRQHYEAEVLNREKSGGGGLGPHAIVTPRSRARWSHSSRGRPGLQPQGGPASRIRIRTTGPPRTSLAIT